MKNLQSPIAQLCIENFQMKNVKRWRGREGNAINANLYFQGRLYCEYLDDASGGGSELRTVNTAVENEIKKFMTNQKFAELMFANGWDFMKKPEAIKFDSMVDVVTEYVDEAMQQSANEKRFLKQLEKKMLTHIVAGNPKTLKTIGYRHWNFRRPLSTIPADQLKKQIDIIKAKLEKDEVILNTNLPK